MLARVRALAANRRPLVACNRVHACHGNAWVLCSSGIHGNLSYYRPDFSLTGLIEQRIRDAAVQFNYP